jgi:hypothetical protein
MDRVANTHESAARVLKCFYANARSIISQEKRMELELYVEMEKPDIIGITESWARDDMGDSELALDGYVMFRRDREKQNSRGGGVLLYVKSDIMAVERQDIKNEKFKESVWCEIKSVARKMLIGVCYRPPASDEETDSGLFELIGKASKETAIIMGDFNFHVDWENMTGQNNKDNKFIDFINGAFLQQHVSEPTREVPGQAENILDLVISTEDNLVENILVGENFGTSDHKIIRWTVELEEHRAEEKNMKWYNYFKADFNLVRSKIKEKELKSKLKGLGVNESWNELVKCLTQVMVETIPKGTRMTKKRPWVTRKVQRTRRAKYKAWKKYNKFKKDNDPDDPDIQNKLNALRKAYVAKRNQSNQDNRKAVYDYESKLAKNAKNDCKSFYKYVRSRQKKKDRVGPLMNDKGIVITDDEEAAETLNKYFGSVFTQEDKDNIPEAVQMFMGGEEDRLYDVIITKEKVVKQLECLRTDKSPGNSSKVS